MNGSVVTLTPVTLDINKTKQELDTVKVGMKTICLKIFCQLSFDDKNPELKEILDDIRKYTTLVDYYIKTVEDDVLLKVNHVFQNHKKLINKLRKTIDENKVLNEEIELLRAQEFKYNQENSFIGNKNDYSNIYHQNKQFEINNKYENKGFDSEESKDAWIYESTINCGVDADEDSTFSFADLAAETSDEDYEEMKVESEQQVAEKKLQEEAKGESDSEEDYDDDDNCDEFNNDYEMDDKAEKNFKDENGELDLQAIANAVSDFIKNSHLTKKRFAEEILKITIDCFNKIMYRAVHKMDSKKKARTLALFKKMRSFLLHDSVKKRQILAEPYLDTKDILARLKLFLTESGLSKKDFAKKYLSISGEHLETILQRQLEYHKCRERTKRVFQRINEVLENENSKERNTPRKSRADKMNE